PAVSRPNSPSSARPAGAPGPEPRDGVLRGAALAHRVRIAGVMGRALAAHPAALQGDALQEGDARIARQAPVEGIEAREGAGIVAQAKARDAGEPDRLRLLRVD